MSVSWKIVNDDYLNYLRNNIERRIPFTDYGDEDYKPFFGNLFEINDLIYITQISHPQARHINMKQNIDFYKIYHPQDNHLIAIINLNYMFPIHKSLVEDLQYKNIDKLRIFPSDVEKSKYIDLMQNELVCINKLNLHDTAKKIYNLKYDKPEHPVSKRSFDFKHLEEFSLKYIKIDNEQ